jgi:ParB-like chromosome segregation protein Spo0J
VTTSDYLFHPYSEIFPLMEGDEFDGLVLSVQKHGLLEPIILFEGKILDGRNRYRAAKEVGHKFVPENFKEFDGTDPKGFVLDRNIHRRHLTTAQKQELIRRLLQDNPSASDRKIAKMLGVNHRTVAAARQRMRPKADIELESFKAKWKEFTLQQRRNFVEAHKEELRLFLR